ncbi:MAG TPA: FkbM family methyltransferase [Hyphomicrobiaceae bacterium]|nr:FkbM family methyltransferase [Hyphomicrobiaceae bacterium]
MSVTRLLSAARETLAIAVRLGQATGRPDRSTVYAARRLVDRRRPVDLTWRGMQLAARGMDWAALQEVLIENEYGALTPLLKSTPEPVVLDLGANIGTFSLFVLAHAPRARVFSYEPSAATFAVLAATAAKNPTYRWTAVQAAAWRADESVTFANAAASTAGRISGEGDERVAGRSFASILETCGGTADIAKLDIEGAEEAVLADQPAALLDRIGTIVVELHPGRCDTDRVARTLMNSYGTVYAIPGRRSSKPLLLATRSAIALGLPVYGAAA